MLYPLLSDWRNVDVSQTHADVCIECVVAKAQVPLDLSRSCDVIMPLTDE